MEINKQSKDEFIKILSKFGLSKKIIDDIAQSVYEFSKEYAIINDVPYLLEQIYNDKTEEIIKFLINSNELITMIKENKIDPKKIAYAKPDELDPDKFSEIIKNKKLKEYKKNHNKTSDAFTCPKCKKKECEVSQKQTRSGDEPPTTFIKCLVCGHVIKF